eukprot:TRINITY_DN77807_c0_g1_i1.p1 TRINITY_DN77807_c0_g1~~TRINITY_DN77807_c0_g1_i1.p1  ORF type:complete len:106 (+),score=7.29 TRINITY_DN77807_c0_g1_i1:504-821(+)
MSVLNSNPLWRSALLCSHSACHLVNTWATCQQTSMVCRFKGDKGSRWSASQRASPDQCSIDILFDALMLLSRVYAGRLDTSHFSAASSEHARASGNQWFPASQGC